MNARECDEYITLLRGLGDRGAVDESELDELAGHLSCCGSCRAEWRHELHKAEEWAVEDYDQVLDRLNRVGFPAPTLNESSLLDSVFTRIRSGSGDRYHRLNAIRLLNDRMNAGSNLSGRLEAAWTATGTLREDSDLEIRKEAWLLSKRLVSLMRPVAGRSPEARSSYTALPVTSGESKSQLLRMFRRTAMACRGGPQPGESRTEPGLDATVVRVPEFAEGGFKATFSLELDIAADPDGIRAILYVHSPVRTVPGVWMVGMLKRSEVPAQDESRVRFDVEFDEPLGLTHKEEVKLRAGTYELVLYSSDSPPHLSN